MPYCARVRSGRTYRAGMGARRRRIIITSSDEKEEEGEGGGKKEGEGRPLFLAVPAPIRVHLNLIAPFCSVCHQQDSPVHVLVCVCIHELIELQPPCSVCLDFMIRRSLRFIVCVCEVCVICNNERVLYVPRGPSRGSMPGVLSSCNCVYSVSTFF